MEGKHEPEIMYENDNMLESYNLHTRRATKNMSHANSESFNLNIHPTKSNPYVRVQVQNRSVLKCIDEEPGPDQTARIRKLIWIFSVSIWHQIPFPMERSI